MQAKTDAPEETLGRSGLSESIFAMAGNEPTRTDEPAQELP